jgi:anti-sigma-K factor RskA
MIPEELQDQAALYALGALDPSETAAFEKALAQDASLRAMVRDLKDAATALTHSLPAKIPPPELRGQILSAVALEKQSGSAAVSRRTSRVPVWLPWAIAALFVIFCGALAVDRVRLRRELADVRAADALAQMTLVTLTSPTPGHENSKVAVAWQPEQQSGIITVAGMPPAGPGRDYQLWAVDENHADPINAGIVHVDLNGVARVRFRPDQKATRIKAFALSLEREGGVPKREGPIVMIGTT